LGSSSSRPDFLSIYASIRGVFGSLVETLDERSVLEYVSSEGLLTVPLDCGDVEKPLPIIEVKPMNGLIRVGMVYDGADEIRHLKNLLHSSQVDGQKAFNDTMKLLPVAVETRLYKRAFKEGSYVFVRKYVASRVDSQLLGLLIDEAEAIRSGGRRSVDGRSVYEAPATPLLYLVYVEVKKGDIELRATLSQMKALVALVVDIKTQKEMIHSRISKPVVQANQYRAISQLLNKARGQDLISAVERRDLEKKWREVPEERNAIEEDLKRRLGETT
jgi:hypothetical protein